MSPLSDTSSDSGSGVSSSDGTPITDRSWAGSPKPAPIAGAGDLPALEGSSPGAEPIAIVGYSMKFPGDSDTPEKFWDLIVNGRNAATEVPESRWNTDGFYQKNSNRAAIHKTRKAHFVNGDVTAFDAPFFQISTTEALNLDPQQRWLLENSYHAFENGTFMQDYNHLLALDPERKGPYLATGTSNSLLANRLSWFFNLKGPSVALDTACSGSLIALHLACQSLRTGETNMGLIGGCNLMLSPDSFVPLSDANFLSRDGKCYSFDHRANGYSRGEGVGMVVVKRLSDAIRDGNNIRAVIRATGSNQDGRTPGITQPDSQAQRDLIKATYRSANLSMADTRYFEAHGTGTPIGDPIEARAITEAFQGHISESSPMYVGSTKANIGHLENVSGIAGLIKVMLVLEKGIIPPNANLEKVNPMVTQNGPLLSFTDRVVPWPGSGVRRASISSSGYGGANCHIVVDDARGYLEQYGLEAYCTATSLERSLRQLDMSRPKTSRLLVLSAADEDGVKRTAAAIQSNFQEEKPSHGTEILDDLCFTMSEKRSRLPWKSFALADSLDTVKSKISKDVAKPARVHADFNAAFVFTGQGAQWPAMGRELLVYPTFSTSLEKSDGYLQALGCKWSLVKELTAPKESSRINEPELSQTICTALQIGLIDLLRHWNVHAEVSVGHSSGEIAAAYYAGGLSRKSALKVAYFRGLASSLAKRLHGDSMAMMAVGLSETAAEERLKGMFGGSSDRGVYIACVNSHKNITLSGDVEKLEALQTSLEEDEVFCRFLKTGVAYHSPYMESVAPIYEALIRDIRPSRQISNVTMVSSVIGKPATPEELSSPNYWVRNMVSTVRFSEALTHFMQKSKKPKARKLGAKKVVSKELNVNFFLEIGPHPALKAPIQDTLRICERDRETTYSPTLQRNVDSSEALMQAGGRMFICNAKLDILAVNGLRESARSLRTLVDLPGYPFNHSLTFWNEGHISKQNRSRKHGYHSLLGWRAPDSRPTEPRWKQQIDLNEQQWIKDHNIFGMDVYPAAGMLVMAIEAAKQMADEGRTILNFNFRNVRIGQALVVPQGTEVGSQLSFQLNDTISSKSSTWYDFRLSACANQTWSDCCNGQVGIEYEQSRHDVEVETGRQTNLRRCRELHKDLRTRLSSSIGSEELYKAIKEIGFAYGPSFQALQDIKYNHEGEATARINCLNWREKLPELETQDHVVHPATLDNIFQLGIVAIVNGGTESATTFVPTRIPKMTISAKPTNDLEHSAIDVYSTIKMAGFKNASGTFSSIQPGDDAFLIEGTIELTAVQPPDASSAPSSGICHKVDWKPDISLMTPSDVLKHCQTPVSIDDTERQKDIDWYVGKLQEIMHQALYHTSHALDTPTVYNQDVEHFWRYRDLVRRKCAELGPEFKPCTSLETFLDEVPSDILSTSEGKLIMRVARNLEKVLTGEGNALELFFSDNLLAEYYQEGWKEPTIQNGLTQYIDILAHKNPELKVLEVGAGFGSASEHLLKALGQNGDGESRSNGARFTKYVYTDISASFFEGAKERFARYVDRMEFKMLDISKDPAKQGFEDGEYDVILASDVLHTVTDLSRTLSHVSRLLKPGGKLLLSELTVPFNLRASFVLGLFSGWWYSSETHRQDSPLLDKERWELALKESGFNGLDVAVKDFEPEHQHMRSVFVSSKSGKTPEEEVQYPGKMVLIYDQSSEMQRSVACELQSRVSSLGVQTCKLFELEDPKWEEEKEATFIFLPELGAAVLPQISDVFFAKLKTLLGNSSGLLWVSGSTGAICDADKAISTGLSRSYRTEHITHRFVNLSVDANSDVDRICSNICDVLGVTLFSVESRHEDEFREVNGIMHTARVVRSDDMNTQVQSRIAAPDVEMKPFRDPSGRETAMVVAEPGFLESIKFVDNKIAHEPLGNHEVEIEVHATGVNFKDVLVALGQVDDSCFGNECGGVIKRKGSKVTNLEIGDRVCAISVLGTFGTVARCPAVGAVKIPESISDAVAASLPVVGSTAVYAMYHVARLAAGESILIHSGAGGLGQVAIQLALLRGATVYTTVGTTEKREYLHTEYGIPYEHIFSSRTLSFKTQIDEITNGRGVDVVLNSLSGEALRETWRCVAPYGRFLEVGKRDFYACSQLPMEVFMKNITFSGIDLIHIGKNRPDYGGQLLAEVMDLAEKKQLKPPGPLHVYPGNEIEKAFRFLQGGKSIGKIVIQFNDSDLVPTALSRVSTWDFRADATYLIAGGLGGLGREISRWMVDRGARNLVLLSRRSTHDEKAQETLAYLREKGATVVTPSCDVANEASLASALAQCKHLPPVRGCVQATMVLRDMEFDDMKLEDLRVPMRPKINGTLNLHNVLPKDLDFFVMFSSGAGIVGSPGQVNYNMGNTYIDELARWRTSQGLKGVSINLGVIYDIGKVAESELQAQMQRIKLFGIGKKQVLAALDHYCDPSLPVQSGVDSQLILGLETLAHSHARGGGDAPWFNRPLFSCMNQIKLEGSGGAHGGDDKQSVDLAAILKDIKTLDEAASVLTEWLVAKLSAVLGIEREDIDAAKPLHALGVDSLIAIELRNWFRKALGADVPVFEILGNSSVADVAASAVAKSPMLQSLGDEAAKEE